MQFIFNIAFWPSTPLKQYPRYINYNTKALILNLICTLSFLIVTFIHTAELNFSFLIILIFSSAPFLPSMQERFGRIDALKKQLWFLCITDCNLLKSDCRTCYSMRKTWSPGIWRIYCWISSSVMGNCKWLVISSSNLH